MLRGILFDIPAKYLRPLPVSQKPITRHTSTFAHGFCNIFAFFKLKLTLPEGAHSLKISITF